MKKRQKMGLKELFMLATVKIFSRKTLTAVAILLLLAVASLYLIVRVESAKITTFEECKKAGWLVRSITIYDGFGPVEMKCELWTGKSFIKQKEVFFPTQREPATSYMEALLSDKLIIKDGCLRAGKYLLVWPYGFSLTADKNGTFHVMNTTGQPVASIGDKIRIGGGADETPRGDVLKHYSADLPGGRCQGPYWIVGEVLKSG